MSKTLRNQLVIIGTLLALTFTAACTPEQVATYHRLPPHLKEQVHNYYQARSGDKFANVVSDAGLARLRQCESGGNYGITNPSGKYRGAYQFDRQTWNSVAARHYPHLRGADPAAAAPHDQDRMARALWSERGRQPWPHCGLRV